MESDLEEREQLERIKQAYVAFRHIILKHQYHNNIWGLEVDDVLQECVLAFIQADRTMQRKGLGKIRFVSANSPTLRKIAWWRFLRVRYNYRRKLVETTLGSDADDEIMEGYMHEGGLVEPPPDLKVDDLDELFSILNKLPEHLKSTMALALTGNSSDEIGYVLGINRGAVHSRITTACNILGVDRPTTKDNNKTFTKPRFLEYDQKEVDYLRPIYRDAINLARQGYTDKAISDKLNTNIRTIKFHLWRGRNHLETRRKHDNEYQEYQRSCGIVP